MGTSGAPAAGDEGRGISSVTEAAVSPGADKTAINARRAERRRQVARTVRDLREKLAESEGVKPQFDYELMVAHATHRVQAAFWIVGLVLVIALVGSMWTDKMLIGSWVALVLSAHLVAVMFARRFLSLERRAVRLAGWRGRFAAADALFGLTFALLYLLPATPTIATDVFQFSTMLIVVAVTAMLAANVPAAMLAVSMPVTATTGASFLIRGLAESDHGISYPFIISVMAVVAQGFFILLGYRLFHASLGAIQAREEKDALIAELEQANAISDESRRKAEEANYAKSRFLATMSHELRTPLNAILGFSEVMQTEMLGPVGNEIYKGYIDDIHNSGRHLLGLINEILDLSRIEAGRYELNEEAVTLPYVVEDCAHMIALRARAKGLTIVEHYEESLPKIWADERAVRQIVLNILSNAVKFTPQGGTIAVKVGWTAGGGQYVSIRDNGPGIPEDEIPVVLSAFGQGSIAIKSAEQGTGLGLNIVQALVQMHGGSFDLKSKLREGTEVTFTMPKSRVMEIMPRLDERPQRPTETEAPRPARPRPVASQEMLDAMRRQLEQARGSLAPSRGDDARAVAEAGR